MLEETKKCPSCAETIKAEAIVCRYCGKNLVATVTPTLSTDNNTDTKSSAAGPLGIISILCGVVGLLVAGIVLGLIAIVDGIVAMSLGNKGGVVGMILGIINILAVLCVYSGSF